MRSQGVEPCVDAYKNLESLAWISRWQFAHKIIHFSASSFNSSIPWWPVLNIENFFVRGSIWWKSNASMHLLYPQILHPFPWLLIQFLLKAINLSVGFFVIGLQLKQYLRFPPLFWYVKVSPQIGHTWVTIPSSKLHFILFFIK